MAFSLSPAHTYMPLTLLCLSPGHTFMYITLLCLQPAHTYLILKESSVSPAHTDLIQPAGRTPCEARVPPRPLPLAVYRYLCVQEN